MKTLLNINNILSNLSYNYKFLSSNFISNHISLFADNGKSSFLINNCNRSSTILTSKYLYEICKRTLFTPSFRQINTYFNNKNTSIFEIFQLKYSRSSTLLMKPIEITLNKRFMQGGGKKVAEEIAKKCIGAGCNSTRPFMQTSTTATPNVEQNSSIPTNISTTPASVSENIVETAIVTPSNNNLPTIKNITKPVTTVADKVMTNTTNSTVTSNISHEQTNSLRHIPTNISSQSTTNFTQTTFSSTQNVPVANIENESSFIQENFADSSTIVDDFVGVPAAPILPQSTLKNIASNGTQLDNNPKTLQEQILEAYKEREARGLEICLQLEELEKRGLFKIQNNEEKLTSEFHDLYKKFSQNHEQIDVNALLSNNNIIFDVGLLEVTNIPETILLTGIQTHVVVVYALQNDQKIVIGYLTSDKSKNLSIKLSDKQPFNYDNFNNKEQRFALLSEPLLIVKGKYLKNLSNYQLNDGTMVDPQKVGFAYINQKNIQNILQEQIKLKIIPKIQESKGYIDVYEGKGVTSEDIDHVITQQNFIDQKIAEKLFTEYKRICNLQNNKKLNQWLDNTQKTVTQNQFDILQQKIKHHEH